mmetsp:Transcript_39048/g.98417  ORF Transcript_39048/g.98417 Transcript_39048/m.98417 type:complete len:477 (-) Transcript_39048:575-2005(-)
MTHFLKKVFLPKETCLVTQSENGPCPLLAIANILILQKELFISTDYGAITTNELVSLVGSALISREPKTFKSEEEQKHYEFLVAEAMETLPGLAVGLFVNVLFTGSVTSFEFTKQVGVFDLFRIPLVHGWLVDPQDIMSYSYLDGKSYNQLMERLVCAQAKVDAGRYQPSDGTSQNASVSQNAAAPREVNQLAVAFADLSAQSAQDPSPASTETTCTTSSAVPTGSTSSTSTTASAPSTSGTDLPDLPAPSFSQTSAHQCDNTAGEVSLVLDGEPPPPSTPSASGEDSMSAALQEVSIIENFLNDTASQLTVFGLMELHTFVKEGAYCVLFRNNHFSVLTKKNGRLFVLVTDCGYAREPQVMWESLSEIDGDSQLFTPDFKPFDHRVHASKPTSQQLAAQTTAAAPAAAAAPPLAASFQAKDEALRAAKAAQEQRDFDLARRLQKEERVFVRERPAPSGGGGLRKSKNSDDDCTVM